MMINGRLLVIANVIIDDTEVDVCEELAGHISDLLVLVVELDSFLIEIGLVSLSQLHIVDSDAIVGKGLTMHITNSLTHLEELLILIDGLLVLSKVIVEDTCRVIGSALITRFASSLAGEGKDVVVLQTLLGSDAVVRIRICHVQPAVILKDTCGQVVVSIEHVSLARMIWFIKV
jgi:hypothetical protein